MKRFALVALVAALLFSVVSSASATELKVRGNIDMYGMWSANLVDHDSDVKDGDNYFTNQRMRTYFDYVANENLKAVLGLEIDNNWGQGTSADWGTDGKGNIEVKHAYLDFTIPDTTVNVKGGLQYVALPSVFGNPVFEDDAAAITVGAQINDMFGMTVGYSRGADKTTNVDNKLLGDGADNDNIDMAFIAAPVTLDGFSIAPYFAYAWVGDNAYTTDQQQASSYAAGDLLTNADGDATIWVAGANAELTMFDPLTFAADLIYGAGNADDYDTKGWYAALAASYKMDFMTATLFTTYATGADEEADQDDYLPTLAEGWGLTPYVGGVRAFSTSYDSFGTDALGVGSDGTGLWTVGVVLDKISFVEKLSHKLVIAYAKGTADEDAAFATLNADGSVKDRLAFTEEDSLWEVYVVNKYMIYENLAAINELSYFKASSELYEDATGDDLDASYFATIGFQYKF
ncbi:outer membrane homotrimeric porin [Desulfomicrobium escambiense]|uniref:outer membrane homotrimeric porin n=1 Tax=Desulfomicrobium escambiense TaxID=29503 RepID=UPI0003F60663|nr:outer membrane homotrimeric porin [Desulfomicrobium escambiense]